jgi:hypothetical protein
MLVKYMIFSIDLLLFYTSNIMNFISSVGSYIELCVYEIKLSDIILRRK